MRKVDDGEKRKKKREELNVGTVPTYKMHNVGTVPTLKMYILGTVPTFKMHKVFYDSFLFEFGFM